jgi:hypothetical protein
MMRQGIAPTELITHQGNAGFPMASHTIAAALAATSGKVDQGKSAVSY